MAALRPNKGQFVLAGVQNCFRGQLPDSVTNVPFEATVAEIETELAGWSGALQSSTAWLRSFLGKHVLNRPEGYGYTGRHVLAPDGSVVEWDRIASKRSEG